MRVAVGTDTVNAVSESIVSGLRAAGHEVVDGGHGTAWPAVGRAVGELVVTGRAEVAALPD